jgi:hypothetical protein
LRWEEQAVSAASIDVNSERPKRKRAQQPNYNPALNKAEARSDDENSNSDDEDVGGEPQKKKKKINKASKKDVAQFDEFNI